MILLAATAGALIVIGAVMASPGLIALGTVMAIVGLITEIITGGY